MVSSTFLACCPWDLCRPLWAFELVLQSASRSRAWQSIRQFLFPRALHCSRREHTIKIPTETFRFRLLCAAWDVASLVESLASHDAPSGDELAGERPGQLWGHPAPASAAHTASVHSRQQAAAANLGLPAFLFHGACVKRPVHLLARKTFLTLKQEESLLRNGCDCTGCSVTRVAFRQACPVHSSNPVARGECDWCELHRHTAFTVAFESLYRKSRLLNVGESPALVRLHPFLQFASRRTSSVPGSVNEIPSGYPQSVDKYTKL